MTGHLFADRPVRDIDLEADRAAQAATIVESERRGRHLNTRARRQAIAHAAHWWSLLFKAAVYPQDRKP